MANKTMKMTEIRYNGIWVNAVPTIALKQWVLDNVKPLDGGFVMNPNKVSDDEIWLTAEKRGYTFRDFTPKKK